MTGIIVFGHGSTVEAANDAVRKVGVQLARRTGHPVETAFLDCAEPNLADSFAVLAAIGVAKILVIPYFLTMGIHLTRDLPVLVEAIRYRYPGVTVEITEPLDGHPALLEILVARASEGGKVL